MRTPSASSKSKVAGWRLANAARVPGGTAEASYLCRSNGTAVGTNVSALPATLSERALILAPRGRDAVVAKGIRAEAGIQAEICADLARLLREIIRGADLVVATDEALGRIDTRGLRDWVAAQPAWSDFPFIVLSRHGGGLERNPAAALLTRI